MPDPDDRAGPDALAALQRVVREIGVAQAIHSGAETALLQSVVDAAVTLFEAEASSIALFEREPDRLEFRVAAGAQGSGVVGLSVAPVEGRRRLRVQHRPAVEPLGRRVRPALRPRHRRADRVRAALHRRRAARRRGRAGRRPPGARQAHVPDLHAAGHGADGACSRGRPRPPSRRRASAARLGPAAARRARGGRPRRAVGGAARRARRGARPESWTATTRRRSGSSSTGSRASGGLPDADLDARRRDPRGRGAAPRRRQDGPRRRPLAGGRTEG